MNYQLSDAWIDQNIELLKRTRDPTSVATAELLLKNRHLVDTRFVGLTPDGILHFLPNPYKYPAINMNGIKSRLRELADRARGDLSILRANATDRQKDARGVCSSCLALELRFLAVADFELDGNVVGFREHLSEAAKIRREMIARFDAGEPISASYITWLGYEDIFNALAAQEFEVAMSLAKRLYQQKGKSYIHSFDEAFGWALGAVMIDDIENFERRIKTFKDVCSRPKILHLTAKRHVVPTRAAWLAQRN